MIKFGIIAAGEGQRLREEGSVIDKPLVEIDGCPMIERLIMQMIKTGAKSINVIINENMTEVRKFLEKLVSSSDFELKILSKKTPSSMHSFYELIKIMEPEDKFVVTTVDTIVKTGALKQYIDTFESTPKEIEGLMGVTTYVDDESPLYVVTDTKENITGFYDKPNAHNRGQNYISAGIYGLRQSALPLLQDCINNGIERMRNFQRQLIDKGLNLRAFDLGTVLDIDHFSDIDKANAFLNN